MNAHAFKVLEYNRILERLAGLTATTMGREAALALLPSTFPDIVRSRLQETREAVDLVDTQSGIPLGGIRDIREAVERAAKEVTLAPLELLDISQTVSASRRIKMQLGGQADQRPLLAGIANRLPQTPGLEAKIAEAIAESGDVRDSASPDLGKIRSARRTTHHRLMEKLNAMVASERYRPYLQEPLVTSRDGRYCLPVKAEYKGQFGGIVHDASSSGATLFIEPGATVPMGNDLKELEIKEEQEIHRVLSRLSALVKGFSADLRAMTDLLANLDLVNARARLALEMDAYEPTINREGRVKLLSARHPLLSGDVMPIDVEVGGNFTVLLITGPNTGGKTVALKTVGLFTLLLQSGCFVPCSPDSEMSIFDQVFADIGDEQDILQSLSTFSSHLKNIVGILGSLSGRSLVLLDEVGAGTDPAEGAALAKAILGELMNRGCRVIATTHYGELKEYAYSNAGIENAAVEFDRETLRPTYRLLLGVPGSSHAFYIAGRMGLPERVLQSAQQFLSHSDRDSAALLTSIEESRRRSHEMEREAQAALNEARAAKETYQQRVQQVEDIRRSVRDEAREEARLALRRVTDQTEHILDELKRMKKGGRKGPAARQKLAKLRSEVADEFAQPVEVEAEAIPEGGFQFKLGDRVKVVTLGTEGELVSLPKEGVVEVRIGAMRATLPLEALRPAAGGPIPTKSQRESKPSAITKAAHISPELMLRALRVDEAAPLLEKYLDDAYGAGLQTARIVHGKGTGALRKWVGDTLKTHPVVAAFHLGDAPEGGDGVTIVQFKE